MSLSFNRASYGHKGHRISHHAGPDMPMILEKGLAFNTNLDKQDLELYHVTIKEYWSTVDPNAIFFISKYATDINGNRLRNHLSLWTDINRDEPFTAIWKHHRDNYRVSDFIKGHDFSVQ